MRAAKGASTCGERSSAEKGEDAGPWRYPTLDRLDRMWASCRGASAGCSSGGRYSSSHAAIHTKPVTPTTRKALRHPNLRVNQATTGTETIRPALVPALQMPFASPRSCGRNHSEVARTDAAQVPASPAPRRSRRIEKERMPLPNECSIAAVDHHAMMTANTDRVPTQSTTYP